MNPINKKQDLRIIFLKKGSLGLNRDIKTSKKFDSIITIRGDDPMIIPTYWSVSSVE